MPRPDPSEYDPFYAGYVGQVPDGDVVAHLSAQRAATLDLLAGVTPDRRDFRYAPEKWSTKQVLGHVIDAEWMFANRALWFARGSPGPLPGMNQDVWMAGARFEERPWERLVEAYATLRAATATLFGSFDEEALIRTGVASDCTFSVRALAWIVAGHELHHVGVLRERYLA